MMGAQESMSGEGLAIIPEARAGGQWRVSLPRSVWALAALVLILLFNYFYTPGFFHIEYVRGRMFGSLVDVLHNGAAVMLLSLGMTLVIGTGGIDLSVGAVMPIAGAVAAVLIARPEGLWLSKVDVHGSTLAVIGIALGVATLAGLWNGLLVAVVDIQPIIATLILMVSGRGIAQLIAGGQIVTFNSPAFAFLAGGSMWGVPFTIVQVAIVAIIAIAADARRRRWDCSSNRSGAIRRRADIAGSMRGR